MTVRSIALALTAAAAFAAVPATGVGAATATATARTGTGMADAWRFVGQYRTLAGCRNAGRGYVARHQARAYKCENDYTAGGDPALDLYIR